MIQRDDNLLADDVPAADATRVYTLTDCCERKTSP